jgi:exonuclease V gamma subunit
MSLKIYYGSRIEDLAAELKSRLLEERRTGDPFEFSQVVVPNANIAKWLQIKMFADTPELSIGIEFPFIEQRLFNLLGACFKPAERPRLMPMNAYANAIMSILVKDRDPRLQPFRRYVTGKDTDSFAIDSRSKARMAWQLAVKLADLMDQYEVRREGVIARWLDATASKSLTEPTETAEAALAQKLFGEGGVFPLGGDSLSLRQLFERAQLQCNKPVGEKQSIYLFGMSTLSSLQVKILYWLAKTHDVVVFHNNVCLEYWGDIETQAERIKNRLKGMQEDEDVRFDGEYDNRLLQQWGRAGRETLRLLVDLEASNGNESEPVEFEWTEIQRHDAADDCTSGSMLAKVQGSIRHRKSEVGQVKGQDASIQIVGAPGVRREVEMVYNAILGAVWKPEGSGDRPWSDCTFSDIAVLVPDMATYRPVIEAVFDARGQIPYGLIDTSASDSSVYLSGFNALMTLAREGLSRETVFGVLGNACVQNALKFTPKDVSDWRRYAKEIGAFDGFDGKVHHQNVSWNRALERLRLGMVANDRDNLPVWQGGDDSALKFSEIVETLYRELTPLAAMELYCTSSTVPESVTDKRNWADSLRRIAGEFLAVGRDEPLEETVRRQLFQTLYALDKVEGRQQLDFVVEAVEEFVGGIKCQKGGYLTHGVTIAGLQPMRPVPFKQVFVLGMGEGLFPGHDSDTTLEIRGARRRLGDTKPSEVKKYLFLETLMATRERLVVSYPCHDIVKDAELFPSGMVCELKSFVEANVLPKDRPNQDEKFKEVKLPLLERGEPGKAFEESPVAPIKWRKEWFAGILPTYSNAERGIAKQVATRNEIVKDANEWDPAKESATDNATSNVGNNGETPRQAVTAKELAEFLESPLRAVLRRHYGISVEGYRDESIDADAPLEIASGPMEWKFQRAILDAVPDAPSATDIKGVYKSFSDKGWVPESDGLLGDYALKKARNEMMGDATQREKLCALKSFTKEFFPDGGSKPDPVRTLSPEGGKRGEMLYTGQTLGWVQSSDGKTCHALVFSKCGDTWPSKNSTKPNLTKFPPKVVLEPLVTWLMMVAGMKDEKSYSLRVGIADMQELLYNAWNWSTTPEKAKKYIDALVDEYLAFLGTSDGDGRYLDYGYSDLAKAIVNAKGKNKIQGDFPASDEEWDALEFSTDDYSYHRDSDFNNDLVIGETMKAWSRMPDESDVDMIKRRFETMHRIPMIGTRDNSTANDNPAHNVEGS